MTENIIRRNSILLPNHDWNGLYSPENYSDLKVLIFGLGKRQAYRPFMFSSNEIYCSPDTTTEYSANGQPLSLQSPVGRYDIKEILDKLLSGWKPDMMVLKMDGTRRNIPVNTDQLKCTKVFIVGAPHHLFAPVRCLLEYLKEEQFDFSWRTMTVIIYIFLRKPDFQTVSGCPRSISIRTCNPKSVRSHTMPRLSEMSDASIHIAVILSIP